jgi:hypothetical protein
MLKSPWCWDHLPISDAIQILYILFPTPSIPGGTSTLRKTSSLVHGTSRSDASWESPSRATAPLEMPRRPRLTSLEPQKPRRGQSAQANIMGLSGCLGVGRWVEELISWQFLDSLLFDDLWMVIEWCMDDVWMMQRCFVNALQLWIIRKWFVDHLWTLWVHDL